MTSLALTYHDTRMAPTDFDFRSTLPPTGASIAAIHLVSLKPQSHIAEASAHVQ